MRLLDSNVIIDAARAGAAGLRELVATDEPFVSAVNCVEVLGYHRLTEEDRRDLGVFFAAVGVLAITTSIVQEAIRLRQIRKMSLGDSFVAGTALVHQLPLLTRNTKDFDWIAGLTVIDPFAPI